MVDQMISNGTHCDLGADESIKGAVLPGALRAVFAHSLQQISGIHQNECQRAGVASELSFFEKLITGTPYTEAVGPAQAIMFLIGALAAEGEAGLVRVERISG